MLGQLNFISFLTAHIASCQFESVLVGSEETMIAESVENQERTNEKFSACLDFEVFYRSLSFSFVLIGLDLCPLALFIDE